MQGLRILSISMLFFACLAVIFSGCSGSNSPPVADPAELTISPQNPTVQVNHSIALTSVLRDSKGNIINCSFIWQSSDPGTATVDGNGIATGISQGEVLITVTDSVYNKSETVTMIVTPLPPPPSKGKIAFYSLGLAIPQIFVIDLDSNVVKQLTFGGVQNADPQYNWDGTEIAYVSGTGNEVDYGITGQEGPRSIMTMDSDGGNVQEVVNNGFTNVDPSFSPDGNFIVYSSNFKTDWNICLYNRSTGVCVPLTDGAGNNFHPSFSPDGSQIVFQSDRSGNSDIYIMNVDGSNVRQLTTDPAWDGMPVFNPGGNIIAFASNRDDYIAYQTWLMGLDGSNQRRVLNISHCTRMPSFSPDGNQFASAANPFNQFDIYTVNTDGTGFTIVTNMTGNQMHPSWAP